MTLTLIFIISIIRAYKYKIDIIVLIIHDKALIFIISNNINIIEIIETRKYELLQQFNFDLFIF